jgi:hypothetical protein
MHQDLVFRLFVSWHVDIPAADAETFEPAPTQHDILDALVGREPRASELHALLAAAATDYLALLTPAHRRWSEYGQGTRRHLQILLDLGVTQLQPLMQAVAGHFTVAEARKARRLFVSWSVRLRLAGGRDSPWDPDLADRRAREIGVRGVVTTEDLAQRMAGLIPDDAAFEAAFASARVARGQVARYLLRALEEQARGESELIPNEASDFVNLEHIMPLTPGADWSHLEPEVTAAYHRRLGNMVLLSTTRNVLVRNRSFEAKRPILRQSLFVLTREAAEYPDWTAEAIKDR